MQNFACPKCGSIDVYIKENGTQTGLYCGDCGKWIKWLGKEEKRLVERWIESSKQDSTFMEDIEEEEEEENSLSEQEIKQVKQLLKSIKEDIQEIEEILGYE